LHGKPEFFFPDALTLLRKVVPFVADSIRLATAARIVLPGQIREAANVFGYDASCQLFDCDGLGSSVVLGSRRNARNSRSRIAGVAVRPIPNRKKFMARKIDVRLLSNKISASSTVSMFY
jgi:hypothetical protein